MSAALDRLLRERRLLVCVGPGGVGKTTAAAALGVRAALLGVPCLVLTVDPARRLATALGLGGLGDAAQEVPLAGLAPAQGPAPARLDAAMLEVGDAHDALIRRIAPGPAAERILANRVYRIMSRTLGASHAYAAMERLGDALADDRRRLVILDTPPTRNALDILDAPGRLLAFLDEGVLTWLEGPVSEDSSDGRRRRSGDLITRAARRLLARIAGASVVADLAEFLGLFLALRPGFVGRARAIEAALRGPECAFVVVTSAAADNLADAGSLAAGLRERGVQPEALLCNRAFTPAPTRALDLEADLADLAPRDDDERRGFTALLEAAESLRARVVADNERASAAARALAAEIGATTTSLAPQGAREPQSVDALAALAAAIVDA